MTMMIKDLKALREEYVGVLKKNIERNLGQYMTGTPFAEALFARSGDCVFLEIDIPEAYVDKEIVLSAEKTDAENARALYEGLKFLTPVQAADEKIWVYLSHFGFYDYATKRILTAEETEYDFENTELEEKQVKRYGDMILRRLFIGKDSHPIGRNILSRLWWAVYLLYDENREDPYELLDTMFKVYDITWGILGRRLNNNKTIARGLLAAFKEILESGEKLEKKQIYEINKALNREAGIKALDVLSEEEIKQLVLSFR